MSTNNIAHDGRDILAKVIMYVFKHNRTTQYTIINNFKIGTEAVNSIIGALLDTGVIGDPDENNNYPVIVNSIDDLDPGIIEFLNEHNFTNEMIADAFKTLPENEKIEISYILKEDRNWRDSEEVKPDLNIPVAIRLVDKNRTYDNSSRTEVFYAEDIKIARWDGDKWIILPPYPKYDYSPLSKYEKPNTSVTISHWGDITVEELNAWQHRFDPYDDYEIKIEVDPEHEEDVYKALMYGALYVSNFGKTKDPDADTNLVKVYTTLMNMQAAMDRNSNNQWRNK